MKRGIGWQQENDAENQNKKQEHGCGYHDVFDGVLGFFGVCLVGDKDRG
ncbi:MAG: hypothetical protein IJ311_06340 [Elusimicrobiaceae bacterium]|nr:hypothetical protein [Elusimicrobiaceae bacterium]